MSLQSSVLDIVGDSRHRVPFLPFLGGTKGLYHSPSEFSPPCLAEVEVLLGEKVFETLVIREDLTMCLVQVVSPNLQPKTTAASSRSRVG